MKAVNSPELPGSDELARNIAEASSDCISLLDSQGRILFMNTPSLIAMGLNDLADVNGKFWASIWPGEQRKTIHRALQNALFSVQRFCGRGLTATGRPRRWDATIIPLGNNAAHTERLLAIVRSTQQKQTFNEEIDELTHYDHVTGLPNRWLLKDEVDSRIRQAEIENIKLGLIAIDIDHFKQINDNFGHHAGDILLRDFGKRIKDNVRQSDLVARIAEDEFAVIFFGSTRDEIVATSKSLAARLLPPFVNEGHLIDCRASYGISIWPDDATNGPELLKNAQLALYAGQTAMSGAMTVFADEMRTFAQKKQEMLELAREALQANRVIPYYQPKINLSSGQLDGFEALLRWRMPGRGIQPPSAIAAAFEDMELAVRISNRIFDRVIRDMGNWLDKGISFGHIGVNASAAEFRRDDFAERVLDQLRLANVPPRMLELEVTETVFLGRGSNNVSRALNLLSAEGVRIALDDFGTGYASLAHLKQCRVDVIKIDQTFIRGLETNPEDTAIVKAVLSLGNSLDLKVVAEGIETPIQAAYLWAQGCHIGQGYLFGKPMPASRVPGFVASVPRKRWRAAGLVR